MKHRHLRCIDQYGIVHREPSWIHDISSLCTMHTRRDDGVTLMLRPVDSGRMPTCIYCIGYDNRRMVF